MMKKPFCACTVTLAVFIGLFGAFGGCQKKTTQVATVPVEQPEPEPIPEPVVEPPVDSSAIIAGLIREALKNIYFDFDRADLRPDAIDRLTIIGRLLLERQSIVITIEGHCDERGSADYNMGLGEKRAQAAKQWLVAYGVSDSRLSTTSYGKERLAAMGCTDEMCHEQNRRCEFVATVF
ncbi:MAG: OmpA family protein [Chitinispirillaceae bacterium]|nr:OmpA family protein [Chitinispirillaceae bacterium]